MKQGICISGGGSKGAWAGGLAQALVEQGKDYQVLTGTSTGSMLIPLVALENFIDLKEAYTNVTQSSIFKVNPFKKNSPDMEINILNIIYNIALRGQKTFGDSTNIIEVIKTFFTDIDYNLIKQTGKDVVACCSNITKSQVEYKNIKDHTYEDFVTWIQASGTFTPFMSIVEKDNDVYCDGGVCVPLPIQQCIDLGATEIDVIILDPKIESINQPTNNAFQIISAMMNTMFNTLLQEDVLIGNLIAKDEDVKLNFYYTPTQLTENCLLFDKVTMTNWWNEGYQFGKTAQPITKIIKKQ